MQIEFSPAKYNFSRIKLNVANTKWCIHVEFLFYTHFLSLRHFLSSLYCLTDNDTMLLYRLIMRLLMSFRIYWKMSSTHARESPRKRLKVRKKTRVSQCSENALILRRKNSRKEKRSAGRVCDCVTYWNGISNRWGVRRRK
jgi:hypothetical protein